jgi:hypothetical protein
MPNKIGPDVPDDVEDRMMRHTGDQRTPPRGAARVLAAALARPATPRNPSAPQKPSPQGWGR